MSMLCACSVVCGGIRALQVKIAFYTSRTLHIRSLGGYEVDGKQSMVIVDSLCAYVKASVSGVFSGISFPRIAEYACTFRRRRRIALVHGGNDSMTEPFNP